MLVVKFKLVMLEKLYYKLEMKLVPGMSKVLEICQRCGQSDNP